MAKKTYIVLKRGILDKQHIFRINNAVWLFLYMLDIVGWDEGIIYEWKDKDAAEELGFSISTIRNQRRQLDELDYITCTQMPHCLQIKIKNWTNPREYSGKVYNKKNQGDSQGSNILTPTIEEGINQGDSQGDSGLTPFHSVKSTNNKTKEIDPLLKELNDKWDSIKQQLIMELPKQSKTIDVLEDATPLQIDNGRMIISTKKSDEFNGRFGSAASKLAQGITNCEVKEVYFQEAQ